MARRRRVHEFLSIKQFGRLFINLSYIESARQLEHETNLDVSKYDVCDNIDLDTILQEYESVFRKENSLFNYLIVLVFD